MGSEMCIRDSYECCFVLKFLSGYALIWGGNVRIVTHVCFLGLLYEQIAQLQFLLELFLTEKLWNGGMI